MAKLPESIHTPHTFSGEPETPAFLRGRPEPGAVTEVAPEALPQTTEAAQEEKKHKRNYDVVDEHALYAFNPNLFKLVPNYKKITQAIKLGFAMPGIQMHREDAAPVEEAHEE